LGGISSWPNSDARRVPKQFCPALARKGWLTQHWPREYGGRDATPWRHAILGEEMWRIGEPRSSQYMNVNWVGPTIMAYGTPEQKAFHLPRISAGNVFWCQGFSEPEAGSDLVSLRTLAVRDGEEYLINGSKIWTSYVNYADYCFLIVRTDPSSKRHHGISVLLMPMSRRASRCARSPRWWASATSTRSSSRTCACRSRAGSGENTAGRQTSRWPSRGGATPARGGCPRRACWRARAGQEWTHLSKLGSARSACACSHCRVTVLARPTASADTNLARVGARSRGGPDSRFRYSDPRRRAALSPRQRRAGVAVGTTEINLNLVAGRFLGLPRE
jgi:hypothetical protein